MRYQFNNCALCVESHQLYVDGVLTTVEPQVFDLLKLFAENAGALISHDQLIETIWAGRIVSDSAISARISAARSAIGDDGTRQQVIKTVPKRGFRFLAEVSANSGNPGTETKVATEPPAELAQRIQFCCSADGTQIASAVTGSGYPLVRAGHWLTHLEYDWHSPVWRPFLNKLGSLCSVVRYDQRGNGLSDWDVEDYSLKAFVEDLEAVVDNAALDKFALYGTSQGAPIAIAYAAKHPDRVSHLVLHGGYQRGRFLRHSQEEREQGEAILTLIRHGWGKPQNAFIQAFASMFIPDGSKEQIESLSELQRRTTSPENAANLRLAVDKFDVSHLLDKLQVPTLVFHARGDSVHPFDQGRKLASGIAGAQFVMLDSRNHVILESEPAWGTLFSEIDRFLAQSSP